MKTRLCLLAVCAALVMGCSDKGSTQVSSGAGPSEPVKQEAPTLDGVYAMEIEKPKPADGKEKDMGTALAEGFGSMFASSMQLKIEKGERFSMSMMGFPIDGKVI